MLGSLLVGLLARPTARRVASVALVALTIALVRRTAGGGANPRLARRLRLTAGEGAGLSASPQLLRTGARSHMGQI